MKVFRIANGPLKVNTYFLVDEKTRRTILIDCGESYNLVKQAANEHNLIITSVFLTHGHFDHAFCAKRFQEDGAKIYIGVKDAPKLLNDQNLAGDFGRTMTPCKADVPLYDADVVIQEGIKIRTINTPGHTDGSVSYLVNNMLFSGDTLFLESVGRTDFPTGNKHALIKSVKKLFDLSGDYAVYPGHGEFTTLEHERKNNQFLDFIYGKHRP